MNKMCTPTPHPEYPEDYPSMVLKHMHNEGMLAKEGPGSSWLRSSRLSLLYHVPLSALIKFAIFDYCYKKIVTDKLKMLCENNEE